MEVSHRPQQIGTRSFGSKVWAAAQGRLETLRAGAAVSLVE